MNGTQEKKMSEFAQNARVHIGIKKKPVLTQERLKKVLRYNPETGIFTRYLSNRGNPIKIKVGCKHHRGYIVMGVDGVWFLAHRLAWLYCYGYLPENGIDHINRDQADNRIKNLREVSQSCNIRNTGVYINNTSGVKGVHFNKASEKWRVQISVNKKQRHLGFSSDFFEAVCIRLAAEQCLNWSKCDSNSSAYRYVKKNINQ
jgi:hypothetical protein